MNNNVKLYENYANLYAYANVNGRYFPRIYSVTSESKILIIMYRASQEDTALFLYVHCHKITLRNI